MKGPWPSWAERERQDTAARLRAERELTRLRAERERQDTAARLRAELAERCYRQGVELDRLREIEGILGPD